MSKLSRAVQQALEGGLHEQVRKHLPGLHDQQAHAGGKQAVTDSLITSLHQALDSNQVNRARSIWASLGDVGRKQVYQRNPKALDKLGDYGQYPDAAPARSASQSKPNSAMQTYRDQETVYASLLDQLHDDAGVDLDELAAVNETSDDNAGVADQLRSLLSEMRQRGWHKRQSVRRLVAEAEKLTKHGDGHDEVSHGNWARGGLADDLTRAGRQQALQTRGEADAWGSLAGSELLTLGDFVGALGRQLSQRGVTVEEVELHDLARQVGDDLWGWQSDVADEGFGEVDGSAREWDVNRRAAPDLFVAADDVSPAEVDEWLTDYLARRVRKDAGDYTDRPKKGEPGYHPYFDEYKHKYHTPRMQRCLYHLEVEQGASPEKAHRICYDSILGAGNRANYASRTQQDERKMKRARKGVRAYRDWLSSVLAFQGQCHCPDDE